MMDSSRRGKKSSRKQSDKSGAKPSSSGLHDRLPPLAEEPRLTQWSHSAVNVASQDLSRPYNHFGIASQSYLPSQSSTQLVQQHNWVSTTNLSQPASDWSFDDSRTLARDVAAYDAVGDQLSEIVSLIDEDSYASWSKEIVFTVPQSSPPSYSRSNSLPASQYGGSERSLVPHRATRKNDEDGRGRNINLLAKVSYYTNSRLPATLPPFRAYISTYPLLCLAALCSSNAYSRQPIDVQNEQLIDANARVGTKAMVVKSVTCANDKTLVFAIRGTSVLSLRDWNVNLHTTPESPIGFLDDDGNYCHSGFLRVARAMVQPIASRLRQLLEENPSRLSYSLLFTGHSAGGAVASLLYAHMLSHHVKSELTNLADCFRRIHCVTFGTPPISLLPLSKPPSNEHRLKRCLFYSFINEGDPVVRAEKSYVMSLVDLITTTPVAATSMITNTAHNASSGPIGQMAASLPMPKITNRGFFLNRKKKQPHEPPTLPTRPQSQPANFSSLTWKVPPATLSNAGRLVVLRGTNPSLSNATNTSALGKGSTSQIDLTREFTEVRAFTVTDEELRKVIFGDPLMHGMEVYRRRIEALAMKAATGREGYY